MGSDARIRLVYTAFLALLLSVYFLINRQLTPKIDLSVYIDNLIPFSAPWSLLYSSYLLLLWYGIGYAFWNFKLDRYKRFIIGLVIIQLVAYILYVAVPGKMVRPALPPSGFFYDIVRWIYATDMPTTLTPSLHVSNSWFIALSLWGRKYLRPVLIMWAILIIVSTLLIKQHYLIDVVSGLCLSTLVHNLLEKYYPIEEKHHGRP